MLKPGGYLVVTDPDPTKSQGQMAVVENDTITCGHCNRVVPIPAMCAPNDMPATQCWGCRRFICIGCDNELRRTLKCDVIENKLERWEAQGRFRRELGV